MKKDCISQSRIQKIRLAKGKINFHKIFHFSQSNKKKKIHKICGIRLETKNPQNTLPRIYNLDFSK